MRLRCRWAGSSSRPRTHRTRSSFARAIDGAWILGLARWSKELLSPDTVLDIQIIRIIIQPGGTSGDKAYNNAAGAKCGTVVAGQFGLENIRHGICLGRR